MTAPSSVKAGSSPAKQIPLMTALVENRYRLLSIHCALNGWQSMANHYQNGEYDFQKYQLKCTEFGEKRESERDAIDNYYAIAQKAKEAVLGKLGLYDNPADNARLKNYQFLAAYDKDGNLQGVCILSIKNAKGCAAKVHYMITAFWNMDFNEPQCPIRTRGAGTALTQQIIQTTSSQPGYILVEPTKPAVLFYINRFFRIIPNWKPKDEGAVCGMALNTSAFDKLKAKTTAICCQEADLPRPVEHYLEELHSGYARTMALAKAAFNAAFKEPKTDGKEGNAKKVEKKEDGAKEITNG